MEIYGFLVWILSPILFLVFLIWAYVPERVLIDLGIYYVPNKYYALAFPAWLCFTAWWTVMTYAALCQFNTHPRYSYFTM